MPLSDLLQRILRKRQSYRRTFDIEDRDVQRVLADLRKFCGVERAVYRVSPVTRTLDANATMVAAGRLEVWQRIQGFLQVNDSDLFKLQEHEESTHE